nr:hypothetical protein [Paracoccus saliphilus]
MDGAGSHSNLQAQTWADLPWIEMPQKGALRAAIADERNLERAEAYDLLRTRVLPEASARNWNRIGISQARPGPAGPLTALNLALSEARRPERRVVLVDLDFARQPIRARLGAPAPSAEQRVHVARLAERLALITIDAPAAESATLLLDQPFRMELESVMASLAPDFIILHLPPILQGDAGLAALPLVQSVLLAIDGRSDKAADLRRCEAYVTPCCPLLGLFLHDGEA